MKKIAIFIILTTISLNIMAQQKIVQTAGRTQLGEFAPEFAHLNDDILFGEVWSRNNLLSLCDRSLVTITSLISQGITNSTEISSTVGKEQRHYPHGSGRNHHPHRLLRRLAKGMGCLQSGKGGMERRCERRRCQVCIPARDDLPCWRTEHRLCQILQGQQLSCENIRQSDTFLQCYL